MINLSFYYIFIIIAPFAELLRFSFFPNIAFRLIDLVSFFFILFNHKLILKTYKKTQFVYIFILTLIISNLFNLNQINIPGALYLGRSILYLLVLVVVLNLPDSSLFRKKAKLINFSLILLAITGLVQYFFYPDLRNLYYLGFDPHLSRLFGLFFDPNLIGLIMVWGTFYYFFYNKNKLFFVLLVISLLLTYSRISWLCFLTGFIYLSTFNKLAKKNLIMIIVSILILSVFLLPNKFGEGTNLLRLNSFIAKKQSYQLAKSHLKDNWLFGIGFNNTSLIKAKMNNPSLIDNSLFGLDNSLLTILFTSGLLGLASYLWFFKNLFSWKNNQFQIFTLTYFIHALSTNSFFTPGAFIFFLLFINYFLFIQHKSP